MKGDFLPPQVRRVRATRVGRHKTQSLIGFLAKGPPPGRHRAAIPIWYRLVPAVVFFTAVGPAVASLVPDEPTLEPIVAEAIDATAPETDGGTTTESTNFEVEIGADAFSDRTENSFEERFPRASTVASPSDSDTGQHQQTVIAAAIESTSDAPLISPNKRIVVRSAPTTTTTTPTTPVGDRTDFWQSIIESIGSTTPTTTTTTPTDDPPTTAPTTTPTTTPTDDPPTTAGVSIVKTESGGAPVSVFHFEVRVGASPDQPGAAVAAGSTDDTGAVKLACVDGGGDACLVLTTTGSSEVRFPPGAYQLCEIGILPGWDNDLNGFTPGEDDGSTECIDIALEAGSVAEVAVDNLPPPGGLGHQTAYWKNWSSCGSDGNQEPVLDDTLALFQGGGTLIGALFVDTCEQAVPLFETSALDGTPRSSDPAYPLAAELLAATLNEQAGAFTCEESATVIAGAQGLLGDIGFDGAGWFLDGDDPATASQREAARNDEQALHQYNTNQLCDRSELDPAPGLLVPILIWPALWLAGRVGRHRRRRVFSDTGR